MHVLVIGGTRYMGRIAVENLLGRGDRVTVFSRGNSRPGWWDRITHIPGDRTDPADFRAKLMGKTFDAVIDTQAFKKEDVELAARTFEGSVGRYLMVSTGSVYLDGKLDFFTHCPFRESDVEWSGIDYTYPEGEDPYGVGKRHCEKWLTENSRVPFTVIRIPAVMGWDDPTARMWWWVQRALEGGPVVLPTEDQAPFRSLYSGDAANAFTEAIRHPEAENQIYHIATEEVFTPLRWVDLIWQAAGAAPQPVTVPADAVLRVLPEYAPPLCRRLPYIHDLSRAIHDFGFRTTPVEEWIQTTVNWYRDHPQATAPKGFEHRETEKKLAASWPGCFSEFLKGFGLS